MHVSHHLYSMLKLLKLDVCVIRLYNVFGYTCINNFVTRVFVLPLVRQLLPSIYGND